jgi:hypothetical protein
MSRRTANVRPRLSTLSGIVVVAVVGVLAQFAGETAPEPRAAAATPPRLTVAMPLPVQVFVVDSPEDATQLVMQAGSSLVLSADSADGQQAIRAVLDNAQLAVEAGYQPEVMIIDLRRD